MKNILVLILAISAFSCGSMKKIAVGTTSEILIEGSKQLNYETDYDAFKLASISNVRNLEAFWFNDQENLNLLSLLVKGYAGIAFAVYETTYFQNQLLDTDNIILEKKILENYTRAYRYGLKFFQAKGISQKDLKNSKDIEKLLDDNFNEEDYVALFYFGQSLGSLVNYQRSNVAILSELSTATSVLNWVCSKKPDLENGNCQLYQAIMLASTPPILGGSIDKAKDIFSSLIKKYPQNLLLKMSYIQFITVPMMDDVEYFKMKEELITSFSYWDSSKIFTGKVSNEQFTFISNGQFNLFNAIAYERFNIIVKFEKDIF